MVIAYEPVWAIGTGDIATTDQAIAAAKVIRSEVRELYGDKAADGLRVLYGGSVKPEFVQGFLSTNEINGLLVGGASLNYKQFSEIVNNTYRVAHNIRSKDD